MGTGKGHGAEGQGHDMEVGGKVVQFWTEAGPDKWFARDDAFEARVSALVLGEHRAAA